MDIIENGLLNINKEIDKCFIKQKKLYHNTIYFTAKYILNKLSKDINAETLPAFNPQTIYNVLTNEIINPDNYNNTHGILPNRVKICNFTIENGYYTIRLANGELVNGRKLLYCNEHKKTTEIQQTDSLNFKYVLACRCGYFENIKRLTHYNDDDIAETSREFIASDKIVFELDNYMNLYYPESGLYLLYNLLPYNIDTFNLVMSINNGNILANMRVQKADINAIRDFISNPVLFPSVLNIYDVEQGKYANILANLNNERDNSLMNNIIKHSNIKQFIIDGLNIIDEYNGQK